MSGTPPLVLLIGARGQLGFELCRALDPLGTVVRAARYASPAAGEIDLDLECSRSLEPAVRGIAPAVIVNAAAYTAVDAAEADTERARQVNAVAPGILAEAARACAALLVHYSTDYVFPGDLGRACTECDRVSPRNVYGETKAAGERAIRASGARHLILRTSAVYSPRGRNFLLTMLGLARDGAPVRVVDDQIVSPTSAAALAALTAQMLVRMRRDDGTWDDTLTGTYHAAGSGSCSWYEFAVEIFRHARRRPVDLQAIGSADYPQAAARPACSALDCGKLARRVSLDLPPWREQVEETLAGVRAGKPPS